MLPNLGTVKHSILQLLSVVTPMNTFFAVPLSSPFAPRSVPLSPPVLCLEVEYSNLDFPNSLTEAALEDNTSLTPFTREHAVGSLGS